MSLIETKPVPEKLSLGRKLLALLPGFCSYCGVRYVEISGDPKDINLFAPLGKNGHGCPNGHEGHLEEFNCGGFIEESKYDNMKPLTVETIRGV